MRGSKPGPAPDTVVELSSEDLVDVDDNRASIIAAAASAQNIAMLTGTHGVVSPPLLRPRARLPRPDEIHAGASPAESDDAELGRLRAFVAAKTGDPVGELRARLELARAELARGRSDAAVEEATAAAQVREHAPAAHAMLRALRLGRGDVDAQLAHVAELVARASSESTRADWSCERARLLEAKSGVTDDSVAAWSDALALVPEHAGALYGAESALDRTDRHAERAELLGRLAELAKNDEAAAWLHVERALLVDRRLSDVAGARAALLRALDLAPGIGPVRAAFVDHAVYHRDDARLAGLLESEASLEADEARAARLELDAALAHLRAGSDRVRILKVLERAHGRAPTSALVDVRVSEELARLYDDEGRHGDALRARKATLRSIDDPREELVALRAIATSAERAGETDAAVLALERARVLEPDDGTLLEDLDRLLCAAERHEARAVLWMREGARTDDPAKKARALLTSADAARAGGREADAAKQREAAWLTAPTAPGVYDALAERLAPAALGDVVDERVRLYEQAIRATKDPDAKIYLLEKLAWLTDDVAGDARKAARVYEAILALEPARLSAILGLASVATRAGDAAALARALNAQADVTADPTARAELRLRAAEALGSVDPERALALAEELEAEPAVAARAREVVTRLHAAASRWDRVADTLARRAAAAGGGPEAVALVLAEADVRSSRLRTPDRALTALATLSPEQADDPAVRAASLAALVALGDEDRLRAGLAELAERASSPSARALLFVRAAELDEGRGRDADAVAAYERAREGMPDEALLAERLARIGARVELGETSRAVVSPLAAAVRAIDAGDAGSAEPLLATGARDFATLRTAERLARRAGSAPQLANALALAADAYPSGVLGSRALEGLASLVAWTLPESDDYEPWERLLALGAADAPGLDCLVHRARARVLAGDEAALRASTRAVLRRVESAADDTERLLLHLDVARLLRRSGETREAGAHCKLALAADPASLTAACLLAEIAVELDDDDAAIASARALAGLVCDKNARAELLRDAADLCAARGDQVVAAELLEQALRSDPEEVQTAARLSALQRSRGAFADLARVLGDALAEAKSPEAIVPIASELAEVAKNDLAEPLLAISALERVRDVAPTHVPSLFLLAELFIGQRAWDKALTALAETVSATSERAEKLVALVGRASIYRRVMNQPALAEAELRAALEIDPHDPRALRGLLDLGDAVSKDERATLLGRLVIGETAPAERLRALLELAEARRTVGDVAGAEGALVEAASLSPDAAMLERVRAAAGADRDALARVLSRAVARAHEGERAIDPTWLVSLGLVELDLGRHDDAVERFEEALRADDTRDDARVALARSLAATGRHEAAATALAPVIVSPSRRAPIDAGLLRLFESSLAGGGRTTEQWIARELRAVAADLGSAEQAELDARSRSLGSIEGLSAASLRKAVMPGGLGRHPVWDVAALAAQLAGKLARVGLSDQGASTRDRVKPRAAHPLRPLFDRVVRAFELVDVELAVSEQIAVPAVACEDATWVIVPASLGSSTDAHALAALARPMARIALGVPWLGALGSHEVLALLVAFARQVAPRFSARPDDRIAPLVEDFELRARRAIDRKRRRLLEELEPSLERAPAVDEAAFAEAVLATEARAAFLLSGSLRASLDAIAPTDAALAEALRVPGAPALAAVFARASSKDLASFALQSETTALRRSMVAL
ncbi:MAG: tetratricopeptide repeat protein [Labilithrix sp.]|nr:tetratricopeptide repeat protein [Labilithrix sp.]